MAKLSPKEAKKRVIKRINWYRIIVLLNFIMISYLVYTSLFGKIAF
jgi:hypothetical protein